MVTIYVDGRPLEVPGRTSASEIRKIAHSEQSRIVARASGGRNVVVSGEIDVHDGDRFLVGRPFTKGMQKFRVLSSKKQRKADRSIRVIFPQPMYDRLKAAFGTSEACAREGYALARCGSRTDGSRKNKDLFVRGLHIPGKEDLFEQSSITVTPRAEFMEAVLNEASEKGDAVVEIHTHVGSKEPNFSWIDIENGLENGRFLRSCGIRFAMIVYGEGGFSYCEYDADHDALMMPESARISVFGRNGLADALVHKSSTSCEIPMVAGPGTVKVAVAGLDEVGFGICTALARNGVRDFTLLDDRMIEPGSTPDPSMAGRKRTKAAYSAIKKISKDVKAIHVNDIQKSARSALRECDVIFVCGPDEALKTAVSEVSLKFFIPCIEARMLKKAEAEGRYGRVRVLVPPLTGCVGCACEDGAVAEPEAQDGDAVCSIAVQELMDMLSGAAQDYDHIEYDPETKSIERKVGGGNGSCALCGRDGVLGAGDDRKPRRP